VRSLNKRGSRRISHFEEKPVMIRALYSAASGMNAQQLNIDNIANNLANANTIGYKTRRAQFQDLMYQTLVQPGSQSGAATITPAGLQLGLGVRAASNEVVFQQGDFSHTGNPLDMVIQGRGFFQIKMPSGDTGYTRAGSFQFDANGNIVDANGNPLQPQIAIPQAAQSVTIATDGTVSYTLPGQTAAQTAGQITLANFQNPAGLNSLGQSYYSPTDASGQPLVGVPGGTDGIGTILQGYVEQSNVSVVDEFINLISSQRAYEANSKVVKAADDMYSQVNNITR
jgi:flagellar basal-body rod protein FlgG